MYIVKVLVLENIPDPILTYYSKEVIDRGSLILVPLRGKDTPAFVMELSHITATKLAVKNVGYTLLPISGVITTSSVTSQRQKKLFENISRYYNIHLSTVLKFAFPSPQKTFLHFPRVSSVQTEPRETSEHPQRLVYEGIPDLDYLKNLIQEGTQCLILAPSSFLVKYYAHLFGDLDPVVYQKTMGTARVRDVWGRVLRREPVVVVGTSASLYLPWTNLCSIFVMNSSHDAYKSQNNPFVDSMYIVSELASLHGSSVLYADTTPRSALVDYPRTGGLQKNIVPIFVNAKRPDRDKRKGNKYLEDLRREIFANLQDSKKSIIFVNRRGVSPIISCLSCGFFYRCPRCSVGFVQHGGASPRVPELLCHRCGYRERRPSDLCPECRGFLGLSYGFGTQGIEREVRALYPKHLIVRFDSDVVKSDREECAALQKFLDSEHGLLITTELLLKHPVQEVDTTIVLDVDRLLSFPDYTTEERVFRVLRFLGTSTQRFYVFTSDFERELFKHLNNPVGFAKEDLKARERYLYPPFCEMIKITQKHRDALFLENSMAELVARLREVITRQGHDTLFDVSDSYPALAEKVGHKHVRHILFRLKKHLADTTKEDLRVRNSILKRIPRDYIIDINPSSII